MSGVPGRSCGSCRCAQSAPHPMMTRYRAIALWRCTCGLLIRNQPLYLLSYGDMKWYPWQDSHLHLTASETVVSALDYMGMKLAASGGIAPPTLRFKGGCSAY